MVRPVTARARRRVEKLLTSTIRDFSGGLNVTDNDLNLSTRFAKRMKNVVRKKDGSIGIRQGTEYVADIAVQLTTTGTLGVDPFATVNTSAVVTVTHTAHGFISGHKNTLSGAAATNGIPAAEINAEHIVTRVDANSYTITVTTPATSTASGGGSSVAYSHDNRTVTSDIVNITYFQDNWVAVSEDGTVTKIDSLGISTIIFNDDIAGLLAGAPSGWGATTFVSFAVFNGELVICNGSDKPLLVDLTDALPCTYLQDLASSSNANTPIARYVLTHDHYTVMTGVLADAGKIKISNFDTSGTWLGDGAPNDAVDIDIGKHVQSQNNTIRGMHELRGSLIFGLDDVSVIGDLGIYDASSNHTPTLDDTVPAHGTIAHRSMQSLGDDLFMLDNIGVPSFGRALFTGQLRPSRISELVDPEIQDALDGLTVGAIEDRVWSVYNQRAGQFMLFIPNGSTVATTTEVKAFVYTRIKELKIQAWSVIEDWNYRCGCITALKRVALCEETKIYLMGSDQDPVTADKVGDPDIPFPNDGIDITFDWELPWADFDKRVHNKHTKYIAFDTAGQGRFTTRMYVDNILEDADEVDAPALTQEFVGGQSSGYGGGTQHYGGGRRTRDVRLWEWNAKFQIAKLRFSGSTNKALRFVAISLLYLQGSIRP